MWVVPFDAAFAALPAGAFVDRYLAAVGARGVVVGWDFTFGKARSGDARVLEAWSRRAGVRLEVVSPVREADGRVVSSTAIRQAVTRGDLSTAASMLGRPVEVAGTVRPGAGRGRSLGFGTANLDLPGLALPGPGVYAGWGRLEASGAVSKAAIHVGPIPTFEGGGASRVEAHLLDHDGTPLAGQVLRLAFVRRLRGTRRFADAGALARQIETDVAQVRSLCAARPRPAWVEA